MSAAPQPTLRSKLIAAGILLGAAEAFFINKVSADNPHWWWWLLLVLALIGAIGCGIAAVINPGGSDAVRGGNNIAGDGADGSKATQQSAGDNGQNISVQADNGSFAANEVGNIGQLNFGAPVQRSDPQERQEP
ncbi:MULTISPECIES: hypothetical protein [Mycobacteriaceae]|uniref:hypothetical protein n=1 Tax=Mycobacteriaceae TaxID=1762 RepID=UPI0009A7882C|nr:MULTISPECIES: hypothetical protein [Mycobacteriaceae]MCQ4363450.1 hypothetical protein [Mycobacterium gordonae]MDO2387190.1 hypothetical protein [Mycobacterium avium subsp. hominissuis]MDO2397685.1 hypothetical protein [Mycobacterium avium subsp. hominissuis]MDX1881581.1 hypothetical protein [Mycolicibacterium sp. 141076]RIT41598.1 hypothetical protein D2E80_23175 [Mycobacteroides abscessus]